MNSRTPRDGQPYYCTYCGSGFAELMACEDGPCEIESHTAALARANLSTLGFFREIATGHVFSTTSPERWRPREFVEELSAEDGCRLLAIQARRYPSRIISEIWRMEGR
jgi:hypothetical protein